MHQAHAHTLHISVGSIIDRMIAAFGTCLQVLESTLSVEQNRGATNVIAAADSYGNDSNTWQHDYNPNQTCYYCNKPGHIAA